MHSSKFIQIRKERSVEQRLASIWLDACCELEIPCILIYQSHWNAYISLNLKFIPEALAESFDQDELQKKLSLIQQKYTAAATGYCQHNNTYHTFDSIPNEFAAQAAAEIFDTIINPDYFQEHILKLEEQQLSA
ncbi:hypothetical protein [Adhaeribacter terreus]|uniref:Uncharacterized protein n=1 Tax=Adhaeribacter terreus TaxID=529703 RepID=A0ABW0EC18_9BACT